MAKGLVSVKVDFGAKRMLRELTRIVQGGTPILREALNATLERYQAMAVESFLVKSRGGVSAGGVRWARLDPDTVKKKKSRRILVRTGRLLESLRARGGRGSEFRVNKQSAALGSRLFYAKFAQRRGRFRLILERPTREQMAILLTIFDGILRRDLARRGWL